MALCLVYNYYSGTWTPPTSCPTSGQQPPTGTTNNGNVLGLWDDDATVTTNCHTAAYSYDTVNRLSSAVGTPCASGDESYNFPYSYTTGDGSNGQYGNMTCVFSGQPTGCSDFSFSTTNNQITSQGYTYDAAGNLTKDSSNTTPHTYQWDAEGRVSSVDSGNTWSFTYNALGHRVQWAYPGGADQHFFDPEGTFLGNAGEYTVFWFAGRFMAAYEGSETYFNHVNSLGSTSVMTNHAGNTVEDVLFTPWGDVLTATGTGGYSFAEMPYDDLKTNTDFTPARVHGPNFGRWFTPDPHNAGADLTDPQTWNMYGYVRNNPMAFVDPTGLDVWLLGGDQCNQGGVTCDDGYVTDENGDKVHLSGDLTDSATLGPNGLSVTYNGQTYSAVWDTNPNENGAVEVAGAPGTGLAGYTATINGNCGGTCLASGFLNDTNSLAEYSAVSSSLAAPGSGYVRNPGLDAINPWHWRSVSFRGYDPAQQEGLPSVHVPVPTKLRLDANGNAVDVTFHVDARYPYEDLVGMGVHLGSVARSIWNSIVRLFGG
jgi:RHS repeat-associated protein